MFCERLNGKSRLEFVILEKIVLAFIRCLCYYNFFCVEGSVRVGYLVLDVLPNTITIRVNSYSKMRSNDERS